MTAVIALLARSAMSGNIAHVTASLKLQLNRTTFISSATIASVVQRTHSSQKYQA